MKNLLITLFSVFTISIASQEKNDWYLLSETGFNQVNGKNKLHFSVGAEYFISNTKSFTLRLKYLKNGIDHKRDGSRLCFLGSCRGPERLFYEASSLKIPLNYKWEKCIGIPKLNLFLTGGITANFKLKENFKEIENLEPNNKTETFEFNIGGGFYYRLNAIYNIYILAESYSGSKKTTEEDVIVKVSETALSFGLRIRLK